MTRVCFFITVVLLAGQAMAAEGQSAADDEKSQATPASEATAPSSPPPVDAVKEAGNETGSLRSLRSKEISEAFKDFQPSEEISADNAVKFPVDI